ncbi:hypothetical protein ACHHYP_14475 [Achlya hypogyna]|uniref:Protein kinase domain-containing protein n=1 Tax=Achlya hypogyna TaxID=1202772 RepID=A0A1V9YD88_ACHHY|nr:hypothetical protein ACHHYP_14475 [Achlya hypogyna]
MDAQLESRMSAATEDEAKQATPKATTRTWSGLKITQFRSRRASAPPETATPQPPAGGVFHRNADVKDYKPEVLTTFNRAIDEKDCSAVLQAVTMHPKLVRLQFQDDGILLHRVCNWPAIEASLELIERCVQEYPEGTAFMDELGRTPLHYLCMNPAVTVRAIQLLVEGFPVSAAMCDKESFLPVHYLCLNSSQTIDMTMMLHNYETFSLRNRDGRTPLHCLLLRRDCEFELCATVLSLAPETTNIADNVGRTVLHSVCAHPAHLDGQLLQLILTVDTTVVQRSDMRGQLPLHLLVANSNVTVAAVAQLLHAFPGAVDVVDAHGQSPLHILCGNEALSMSLLDEYTAVCSVYPTSLLWVDDEASTSLHILCVNAVMTTEMILALYALNPGAASAVDKYGCTPFHYACANAGISIELIWLFLDHAHGITSVVDQRGKTPLHYLVANAHASAEMISIVFDADPTASQVTDHAMKLPVHYVIENPAIPSAHAYRLLTGGASYRQRYVLHDRAVTEFCTVAFENAGTADELFTTTDTASDGGAAVTLHYCSSAAVHRHLIALYTALHATPAAKPVVMPPLLDSFENARRRIRQSAGTSRILEYCVVTTTPKAPLSDGRDAADAARVLRSVSGCLAHWHHTALVAHGNITPHTIFCHDQEYVVYPEYGSTKLHDTRDALSFAVQAIRYCAPETARALLGGTSLRPTPASDIWQLGCTVFEVATGTSFLETIAPFAAHCSFEEVYHILASINDRVVAHVLKNVRSDVQHLLRHVLVPNAASRWTAEACEGLIAPPICSTSAPDATASENQRLTDEVASLRAVVVDTKTRLRRVELERDNLQLQLSELVDRLNAILLEKEEATHHAAVLAKKRASLAAQLDTMVHMLISLMPLAQKVYGAMGDDLLARLMSHAALGTAPESHLYALPAATSMNRMLRERIRDTMLARGCVGQWANAPTPVAFLEAMDSPEDQELDVKTNP